MTKNAKKNKEKTWYTKPESLIPIIISIISLSYTIYNGYRTEHLSRDVYVPKLEAKFEMIDANSLIIDVFNSGLAAAQNIVVEISWIENVELSNCSAEPPYQDLQPIKPMVDQNLSYRLPRLPIDGEFKITCQSNLVAANNLLGVSEVIMDNNGQTINPMKVKITADNTKSTGETFSLPIFFSLTNP